MTEKPAAGYLSEADLVSPIIAVLRARGGRAEKSAVEKALWEQHSAVFSHPYYQERVSGDIPRWKHYIAWAKEHGKHEGLIKRPSQSGYGCWELTDETMTAA